MKSSTIASAWPRVSIAAADQLVDLGALAAQVAVGDVEEARQRAVAVRAVRAELLADVGEAGVEVVDLDRHGGAVDRQHGAVRQLGARHPRLRQLHEPVGHQRGRDDDRGGVVGGRLTVVETHRHGDARGTGVDTRDLADRDAQHLHVGADVQPDAGLEDCLDGGAVAVGGGHDDGEHEAAASHWPPPFFGLQSRTTSLRSSGLPEESNRPQM